MINDGNEENDIKDVKIDEDEILKKNQNTSLDELIKNNSD